MKSSVMFGRSIKRYSARNVLPIGLQTTKPLRNLVICTAALCALISTGAETNLPTTTLRSSANTSLRHEVQHAIDKGPSLAG